ncbi:methylated-DNA--[protein]-cysteine S-methyltransferase [Lacticaseibacillus baoqingensis]|uniref:Methylated-DNA--[protein]-cysteine S-methyltransferase n=1 Tax=Lacticaseibacillus baoqingensis TaxID=2486013 RepID=A0ABW4E3H1_9LACO|nr:methylated-DNA--[protein]-cysteine S-methyltransferase [Lacticaseibacillus baoqingensis]
MLQQITYHSPLGPLVLLGDDQALWGVWFADQQYFGAGFELDQVPNGENASLQAGQAWLKAYFAGHERPRPALHFSGTLYRQAVQRALTQIPRGTTVTYQQLAEQVASVIGHPTAARAIGGAVGHNPLSVIVPCHRVVGTNGSLTGYAGGVARKQALLQLEGALAQ